MTFVHRYNLLSDRRTPSISNEIKELLKPFEVKLDTLRNIVTRIDDDLQKALRNDGTASMQCFQTYVQDFPNGEERGQYLAVDLGGSHFRIMLVTLNENQTYELETRTYTFPEEKMTGTSEQFFGFIADCVDSFEDELNLKDQHFGLGFCFSFPVHMKSLTKAYLSKWTKRFNVTGVEGKEIVSLLRDAFDKKKLKIEPIVVLNDTTGCLLSCSSKERTCRMGVIVGTGMNICYIEKIQNIADFKGNPKKPYMIINTEINSFGDNCQLDDIVTEFDLKIDCASKNPGVHRFEKMISAMYLGELVRLLILKCVELKYLFEGETSEMLRRKNAFLPEFIYEIESDTTPELHKTLDILEVMRLKNVTFQDCVNVRCICATIYRRSADLMAAAVAAIIQKMDVSPITVAYDGGIYRKHPTYKDNLHKTIKQLIDPKFFIQHEVAEDGSGRGAALVASMYMSRIRDSPKTE